MFYFQMVFQFLYMNMISKQILSRKCLPNIFQNNFAAVDERWYAENMHCLCCSWNWISFL